MLEQISPFRSTFALAGWVFADLLLVFAILFFASAPASHADLITTSPVAMPVAGTLLVSISSGTIAPYSGACVNLDGRQVCDNSDADADATGGKILITGLVPGTYRIDADTLGQFHSTESKTVNIHQNEEERVDFVFIPFPTATATAEPTATEPPTATAEPTATEPPTAIPLGKGVIYTRDPVENSPIAGACYRLTGPAEVQICDGGGGDADSADGNITVTDLPVGYYEVEQTNLDADVYPAENQVLQITTDQLEHATFYNRPRRGSLSVYLTAGDAAPESCFVVYSPTFEGTYCDNDTNDADPTVGHVLLNYLQEGVYTVSGNGDHLPSGYLDAQDQTTKVVGGKESSVELLFPPAPQPTVTSEPSGNTPVGPPVAGRVQIVTRSGSTGEYIAGACYELTGPTTIDICDGGEDDADADLGQVRIRSLPTGAYALTQTIAPDGYRLAGTYSFSVLGKELDSFVVYNVPKQVTTACVPALDPELIELTNVAVTYPMNSGDKAAQDAFISAFRAALEPELEKRGESWGTFKGGVVLTFGRLDAAQTGPGSVFAKQLNDLILALPQFEGAATKDFISLNSADFSHIDMNLFIFRTSCG